MIACWSIWACGYVKEGGARVSDLEAKVARCGISPSFRMHSAATDGAIDSTNPKQEEDAMASQSLTPFRSRSLEPFRSASPFLSFYREANRLFEDVFREFDDARETLSGILAPSIDVTQNDREWPKTTVAAP